jgi:hypothetical protein
MIPDRPSGSGGAADALAIRFEDAHFSSSTSRLAWSSIRRRQSRGTWSALLAPAGLNLTKHRKEYAGGDRASPRQGHERLLVVA